ncbi:ParB N-terminal domain-containing protein [Brevundimonas staleyi]|uniref:ParB N-terminal domain-containing protein n=1 Tax=Brevundimonas staleyi TaxID=74326 RepID=A0ABW0FUB9_9CAUL
MTDTSTPTPDGGTRPAVVLDRDDRTVRLGDLDIARENLRCGEPPDEEIPTLAATLRAAGQLQPLTVRPGRGRKEAAFMALDGRRRLLALGLLRDAGEIDADYPVRVFVETDPARQAAAVLLTNTAVPVHVAYVIAAIGRMLKSRLTIPAIARALGYAEIEIKRLSALAALPSAALVALKAGRMSLKQARLLARLPDAAEQAEIAEAVVDGHGFQDWRILERLDDARVTTRDRRCALVGPDAYARAGGRTESDLFGELPDVLLDPDLLAQAWLDRVRGLAAVFEAEGLAVHLSAGAEPETPEGLEALGWVYEGDLSSDLRARYRDQRELFHQRTEAVRDALATEASVDVIDRTIVDRVHARIALDQAGAGDRLVTTVALWPTGGVGVDVRCYTPEVPEMDEPGDAAAAAEKVPATPVYVPPSVEPAEPETDGVNHVLHALRTEVATRGLIRALADDPGAALTAMIARLFTVLVLRTRVARSDSALTLVASGFAPTGGRVIEALDGAVRRRLEDRHAAFVASGETVIAWIHGLPHGEKMGLLAELVALSLDARETRTDLVRRPARSEATELAALCEADITLHLTPDPPFLQAHSRALLTGMLTTMGAEDPRAAGLKKTELVDWVAEQAAERRWAPPDLSWRASAGDGDPGTRSDDETEPSQDAEGAGAFEITAEGQAALAAAAA